ncbi:MAG: glutamate--tRNA ligase [Candidatus Delongbacteria bacterium]
MRPGPVVTRIAPSPTGDPHIGTVFMALFNLAFARRHGGRFILRIEDTDQGRSTRESEEAIFAALRWAGIPWDEGPDKGGPNGPYRQSERLPIYEEHVARLVEAGKAYPCFCDAARLKALREEQLARKQDPRYDGHCQHLDRRDTMHRVLTGEAHVIRLAVPDEGECVVPDRLRGEIRIAWSTVDHQILRKTDGFPTYHLANVVDDRLMGVTHVIRGEEWISSLPKHVLLYEGFGWELPEFIHMPLLRNPDKSKLSKRKNPTSVTWYREAGYLPEAVLNYLGMMGYTLPDGREMFTLDEFIESFEIDRVVLGGPVFDLAKLNWLNGRYLRERLTPAQILERLHGWRLNDELLLKALPLTQKRLTTLADFVPMTAFLLRGALDYDSAELVGADGARTARWLRIALWQMEQLRPFTAASVRALFEDMVEREGANLRELLAPFFLAVTGAKVSLPLFDSCELLGADLTRRRLQEGLERLAAAGHELKGKTLKALEEDYRRRYVETR